MRWNKADVFTPKTPQSLCTRVATVRLAEGPAGSAQHCSPSPSLEPLSAEHQAVQMPSSSEGEMEPGSKSSFLRQMGVSTQPIFHYNLRILLEKNPMEWQFNR